ncbi:phosphoenolpyruvate--protein phosphotransferase [Lactobacillaceae bacterium 24-114]
MSTLLNGLAASSGIVIAPAYRLVGPDLTVNQQYSSNENHEVSRLHDSFTLALSEVKEIRKHAQDTLGKRAADVIDEQLVLLTDPTLTKTIINEIKSNHYTAEWALKKVTDTMLDKIAKNDELDYLASRPTAVKDASKRVLAHLLDVHLPDLKSLDHRVIIVANSITPTDVAQFDRRFVGGIVTNEGGRTSHFTIMSKNLSIPTVVGTNEATEEIEDGSLLIVDGIHGKVVVRPSVKELDHYQRLAADFRREQQSWGELRDQPTVSTDGRHYQIVANVGSPTDISAAQKNGAEGIGLLRTEFLYANNKQLPSENEQTSAYKQILTEMNQQLVVARTLDVGGDKQLPMIDLPKEENPALGYRAIRVGLNQEKFLRTQLRALLRASVYGQLAIMFPMIATVEEFRTAREILDEEKQRLQQEGFDVAQNIEVGMMLEVPSAAVMADTFAREVDFFSIGSNDLIQYLFAADRGNPYVSNLYQELHPAVLRLIKQIIDAAHAEGKWVSLCGEMAANPLATPLLIAMGLDEFSMNSVSILQTRALINRLNTRQLQPLVHRALNATTASEVQQMIREEVPLVNE